MEENKQVVAEWKQQNQDRLKEIKTFNPDLYSAINMALSYLNKTLTGEELPVEVEEKIVEPQQTQELSVLDVASVSTLSDFYNTKMIVDTPEKSAKFQQLIIDLGGKWDDYDVKNALLRKTVNFTDKKYLAVTASGTILFYDTQQGFEDDIADEEIFYDDIFKVKETPSTKSETSEWRLKTKQELESEFGTDFARFSIPEGYFNDWYGQNLAEIYTSSKYADIKEAEDYLMNGDILLGLSAFTLPNRYFTKDILTSSQTSAYKLPIDTYPVTLKNNYSFFVANDGSRQSPTQSAGDLKRMVMPMGTDEIQEIRRTFFRGNDGQWYEINVGKGGTWTWKKLNPVENYETQIKFIEGTQSTAQPTHTPYIPTSTPQPAQTQPTKWSYYDLVGRQLDWNGSIYEVVKLNKINPKKIIYDFKNSKGGIEPINVPKTVVEALLTESRIVAGVKLLPKQQQSTGYDYTAMSDIKLKSLAKDTQEARDAFEFDDPEYAELTTQVGLMIDEMKRRNIL
jgi:hypothetical protein